MYNIWGCSNNHRK